MARLSFSDLEKYGNNNSSDLSYFKLSNDKDEAQVRVMLNKLEDMEDGYMFSCHEVKVEGSEWGKAVACLREYNDPVSKCPFCEAGYKVIPKIYIPLYNEDTEEVQIWTRGKGFMQKFTSICSRYSKPTIVSHLFTIQRNGESGSMQTTYEMFMDEVDDTVLEDLPEVPKILGRCVLDKSAEEMEYYLQEHEFPSKDDSEEEKPIRRRGSHKEVDAEEQPRRRSSSRRNSRGSDDTF